MPSLIFYEKYVLECVLLQFWLALQGFKKFISEAILHTHTYVQVKKNYKKITKKIELLCFRHLSESRLLAWRLTQNFCHDLMQNHLS